MAVADDTGGAAGEGSVDVVAAFPADDDHLNPAGPDIEPSTRPFRPQRDSRRVECPSRQGAKVGDAGAEIEGAITGRFAFAPDYEVRLDGHGLDGETLCCWGEIAFTPAFTFGGAVPNGNRVSVPVFILCRLRDGRVSWESFHFDVAGVARQCGVDATALVRAS